MILGLMTTDLPRPARKLPMQQETWRLLAAAGREAQTPVLFFHPHALDRERRRVEGFWLDGTHGWKPASSPIPRVIVDQVFLPFARRDKTYASHKRSLEKAGHLFLNPRLPDKWGVWRTLLRMPLLRPYLPETLLLHSEQDVAEIEQWLGRYPSVFVKPARGSGGQGIWQVERLTDDRFFVRGDVQAEWSRDLLLHYIGKRFQGGKHLLQRGLQLFHVDGCNLDLRVVLHRDGDRNWKTITVKPRLGPPGSAVTNLAQGGRIETLDWLAAESAKQGLTLPPKRQIEQLAQNAAKAVTTIRPTLAFLGIDIALDTRGRLWLLDINPRPGRKSLSPTERARAFSLLVAYAGTLL